MPEKIQERIVSILDSLKDSKTNDNLLHSADLLTFVISLIPIPGIEQVGQVANKIVTDKQLQREFLKIRGEILAVNQHIQDIDSELGRIGEIASTVKSDAEINRTLGKFVALLEKALELEGTEFVMETTNESIQVLIDQIIEVDWLSVLASYGSQNILKHTKIQAKKTHLKASDKSINIVDGTEFKGPTGSISMNGIKQSGEMEIANSSFIMRNGSKLIFDAKPRTVAGNCPICNFRIEVEVNQMRGITHLKCPSCKSVLPIKID